MPYERRAMELMKVGRDKRAFKYVKARVCILSRLHRRSKASLSVRKPSTCQEETWRTSSSNPCPTQSSQINLCWTRCASLFVCCFSAEEIEIIGIRSSSRKRTLDSFLDLNMERTPMHDPSMTPSPNTTTTGGGAGASGNAGGSLASKSMIYTCGECHRDNELKSTDVIRCKSAANAQHIRWQCLCLFSRHWMWLSNLVQKANETTDCLRCQMILLLCIEIKYLIEFRWTKLFSLGTDAGHSNSVNKQRNWADRRKFFEVWPTRVVRFCSLVKRIFIQGGEEWRRVQIDICLTRRKKAERERERGTTQLPFFSRGHFTSVKFIARHSSCSRRSQARLAFSW